MALTSARNTMQRQRAGISTLALAASVAAYQGGLAALDASGYVTKGQTALGLRGIGRFLESKTGGAADGDESVLVEEGLFAWKNSSAADAIAIADRGQVAYIVDDETVAKTSGSGTRSPAGIIIDVDANDGVWLLMGTEVLAGFLAGRKKFVPLRLTTIAGSGSPAYRTISPFSGRVTKVRSITEGALTTGDATLTPSIGGTAITNGVITVAQSGSAAGDKDEATPTANNYVAAGDELKVVVTGSQASATAVNFIFEIDAD